jgi:hypothetical protein
VVPPIGPARHLHLLQRLLLLLNQAVTKLMLSLESKTALLQSLELRREVVGVQIHLLCERLEPRLQSLHLGAHVLEGLVGALLSLLHVGLEEGEVDLEHFDLFRNFLEKGQFSAPRGP